MSGIAWRPNPHIPHLIVVQREGLAGQRRGTLILFDGAQPHYLQGSSGGYSPGAKVRTRLRRGGGAQKRLAWHFSQHPGPPVPRYVPGTPKLRSRIHRLRQPHQPSIAFPRVHNASMSKRCGILRTAPWCSRPGGPGQAEVCVAVANHLADKRCQPGELAVPPDGTPTTRPQRNRLALQSNIDNNWSRSKRSFVTIRARQKSDLQEIGTLLGELPAEHPEVPLVFRLPRVRR